MDVTPDEVPKVMIQHQVQHLIPCIPTEQWVHQLELADGSWHDYVLGIGLVRFLFRCVSGRHQQLPLNLPQGLMQEIFMEFYPSTSSPFIQPSFTV
jgi:hypothetical protein